MKTTIHAKRPAVFPNRCVRCLSREVRLRKFTDAANAVVVTVSASLDIPVCEKCWKAPRRWWIAAGIMACLLLAAGIPFAIAQDNHANIPKIVPILVLLLLAGVFTCLVIGQKQSPVRLVPTKMDSENIRVAFFNSDYAKEFVAANKETSKVINPWKFE